MCIDISLDTSDSDQYNRSCCKYQRGYGAAGARFLGMEEVRGSIPLSSTIDITGFSALCRKPVFYCVPCEYLKKGVLLGHPLCLRGYSWTILHVI